MHKPLLAAAVATIALAAPSLAHAGDRAPSTIQVVAGNVSGDKYVIAGTVDSTKKCEKNRTVELYFKNNGKVLDTDTTSNRGAFGVALRESDGQGDLYVRVLKTDECGSDKTQILF